MSATLIDVAAAAGVELRGYVAPGLHSSHGDKMLQAVLCGSDDAQALLAGGPDRIQDGHTTRAIRLGDVKDIRRLIRDARYVLSRFERAALEATERAAAVRRALTP